MRNETRVLYNAYLSTIAQLNGVDDATVKFAASPSVQQTLEQKIQESSEFLRQINMYGVQDMKGEKIGMGIGSTIASNTDTSGAGVRQTQDPTTLDTKGYECRKNNFDTHIKYAKLDQWAKFKNFQILMRDAILKRQALDRMMIGFNGTSYAADSDRGANPLLQDVNIGWLQKYRNDAPARVLSEGASAGVIDVFGGGDYENLDAVIFDAVNNLIDPWYQDGTDLVVIMGRSLLADKYFPMINQSQPATEQMATDLVVSQKRVGNLPAARVPNFPANGMMVTSFDNLSIYFQEGARRRHVVERPEKDQIENYESSNDDYVVEDYGKGCLIENINTTAP